MPRPQTPLFRNPTRTLARAILEEAAGHPSARPWTAHSLGVLRAPLPGDMVLHVWCPDLAEAGAAAVHSHPWRFSSFVIAGVVDNHRYEACADPGRQPDSDPSADGWLACSARPFRDRAAGGSPEPTWIRRVGVERVRAGQWYTQDAEDIHESRPMAGTVTLVQRQRSDDTSYRVFCPPGTAPGLGDRPATEIEVAHACRAAIERWFS